MPDFGSLLHEAGIHAAGNEAGNGVGSEAIRRRSRTRRVSAAAVADGSGGEEDVKGAGDKDKDYRCRFCAQVFEKSQALGGHMNRHRPEREKEQFEHAQHLVAQQQQMPRTWSSMSAPPEMIQSPSGAGGSGTTAQRLSSHLSLDTTHQQYIAPPISFGTLYRPTSPTNCNTGTQLPPSPGSNCNFYLPSLTSNASSCNNLQGNTTTNMQNQLNQQQLQQWLGSMDGFSTAALSSPRATPRIGSGSFYHHPAENMAISFQAASVPPEVLANMFRNSSVPNVDSSPLVSPGTPTSSQGQAPETYDVMYNSHLANAFFNSGM